MAPNSCNYWQGANKCHLSNDWRTENYKHFQLADFFFIFFFMTFPLEPHFSTPRIRTLNVLIDINHNELFTIIIIVIIFCDKTTIVN